MARSPAAPPEMNISITTAIKAGFFGAIGFFVAQVVLVPVTLLLFVIFGVSLAGLGIAGEKLTKQKSTPTAAPARWSARLAVDTQTR